MHFFHSDISQRHLSADCAFELALFVTGEQEPLRGLAVAQLFLQRIAYIFVDTSGDRVRNSKRARGLARLTWICGEALFSQGVQRGVLSDVVRSVDQHLCSCAVAQRLLLHFMHCIRNPCNCVDDLCCLENNTLGTAHVREHNIMDLFLDLGLDDFGNFRRHFFDGGRGRLHRGCHGLHRFHRMLHGLDRRVHRMQHDILNWFWNLGVWGNNLVHLSGGFACRGADIFFDSVRDVAPECAAGFSDGQCGNADSRCFANRHSVGIATNGVAGQRCFMLAGWIHR